MPDRDFYSGRGGSAAGGSTGPAPSSPGTLTGATPGYYSGAYGGHPGTANPNTSAATSIAGNLANLPSLFHLLGGVNSFQNQQALHGLQTNLPGYNGMVAQSSNNIASHLAGHVDNDVINQLLQGAAERGIMTGGGANSNAAYLRALGLTSHGLQQQGEQELTGAINRTPVGQPMNPGIFMTTPGDIQGAQQYANNIAGAPIPAQAAAAARAAAQAGLQHGAGSVPGYSNIGGLGGGSVGTWDSGTGGLSGPGMVVGNSTGSGTYRNGILYGGGNPVGGAGSFSPYGGYGGGSGMGLDDMASYLFNDDWEGSGAPMQAGTADMPYAGGSGYYM